MTTEPTTSRYIARCYTCKTVQSYSIEAGKSACRLCPQCRKMMNSFPVRGTYNPTHKCTAKCTNAIGPACECECAGANHGAGHAHG